MNNEGFERYGKATARRSQTERAEYEAAKSKVLVAHWEEPSGGGGRTVDGDHRMQLGDQFLLPASAGIIHLFMPPKFNFSSVLLPLAKPNDQFIPIFLLFIFPPFFIYSPSYRVKKKVILYNLLDILNLSKSNFI